MQQEPILKSTLVESIIAGEKDPSEVANETHEANSNAESVGRLLYNENKLDPALKWARNLFEKNSSQLAQIIPLSKFLLNCHKAHFYW